MLEVKNGFARALRKNYSENFEDLMDICLIHRSVGSNVSRTVLFEAMVMCILVKQQKTCRRKESGAAAGIRTRVVSVLPILLWLAG